MKTDFSKSHDYTPDWNGNQDLPEDEQIKSVLDVLDMDALMALLDAFTEVGLEGEVDTDTVDASKIKPVLEQFGDLLPKHVSSLTGLFGKAGEALTIEDVVKYPKFLNLSLEFLMELSRISSPTDDDTKNSNEPSV